MINPFRQAAFLISAAKPSQAPADQGWEVAFAGRSNAGKSSAINALCEHKALARTSKTPGRTQLLNFFRVDDDRRLVDLPGYGYAKVSADVQRQWQHALEGYLVQRESLRGLILLMDIRHPFTPLDQQLVEWAVVSHRPVHILLTKADKLSRGPAQSTLHTVRRRLTGMGGELSAQTFSSLKHQGLPEAYEVLQRWLEWPSAPR